jgi:hypothetical protein
MNGPISFAVFVAISSLVTVTTMYLGDYLFEKYFRWNKSDE